MLRLPRPVEQSQRGRESPAVDWIGPRREPSESAWRCQAKRTRCLHGKRPHATSLNNIHPVPISNLPHSIMADSSGNARTCFCTIVVPIVHASTEPASEYTPLIGNGDLEHPGPRSFLEVVKGTGEHTWAESLYYLLFTSFFNLLLLFIPLSATAHYANWDAGLRFLFSFLAIIPLARVSPRSIPLMH